MPDYALMNQLLFEGKHEPVKKMTEDALAEGRSAMEVLEDGLIGGMRVVGEDFKHNRIFVPEVLLAARAMKAGMAVPLLTAKRTRRPFAHHRRARWGDLHTSRNRA
jgi:5-methyltetrahydrofolate--homocysteine methyltransferase